MVQLKGTRLEWKVKDSQNNTGQTMMKCLISGGKAHNINTLI